MRCVNMHRPVLLFILRSSQPANPQIPAEEETFRMRTHCGFPCKISAGHLRMCGGLLSGQFWVSQVMGLPWVHDGTACAVRDIFSPSLALSQSGCICETHLAFSLFLMFACRSQHYWGSSEKLELASWKLFLWGASLGLNFPLEFHFPGMQIASQVVRCKIIPVLQDLSILSTSDENKCMEYKYSIWRTKALCVQEMGTFNSYMCREWSRY